MSTNKTIVITGTNKGIGFDLVKLLCSKGMEVIATCRDEKKCDALKTAVPHARFYILDLDDEQSIASFAEQITNDYSKIDILINNAGAMLDGEWVGNTVSHIVLQPCISCLPVAIGMRNEKLSSKINKNAETKA